MLRIAAVVSAFPTSAEPQSGMPIFNQMKAMAQISDLTVYVVRSRYPSARWFQPTTFLNRDYDPRYTVGGIDVRYVGYPAFPLLSRIVNGRVCARQLRPLLAASRPDVILSYFLYPEAYAAVHVGRALGIPVVAGAVGSDLLRIPDLWTRMLVSTTLRKASHVVTKSRELRDRAIELGASSSLVTAIPNGCDGDLFRLTSREAARAKLSIDPDAKLAVFTGRLVTVKALPHLIDAVALVRRSGEPLQLAIIGDGPLRSELEALAKARQVEDAVSFLGTRRPTEVADWLAASNVLCLSSYSEGCPNVILEALCCGRPVVATNVGGIPDIVDSNCGVLVAPGDPSALATGLLQALRTPWNEELISRSYRRDWSTMARETLDVCALAVRRNGRPWPRTQVLEHEHRAAD